MSLEITYANPLQPDRADEAMLLVDLGGTHLRMAVLSGPDETLDAISQTRCSDESGIVDALIRYLAQRNPQARRPTRALLAVATPTGIGPVRLTNLDWTVDPAELRERACLREVRLINDFEALAMGLPGLTSTDIRHVGNARVDQRRAMAVIGPGTGLGVAAVVPICGEPGRWQALAGEGGHVTLSAFDQREAAIIAEARRDLEHVSAERLLSGLGLPLLRRAIVAVDGLACADELDARAIGESAVRGDDELNYRTAHTFCALLGGVAGNLALTLGAHGGVFLAGGILPKWGRLLDESLFRERFEAKGRFRGYLSEIGTAVITQPHASLLGLARLCAPQAMPQEAFAVRQP